MNDEPRQRLSELQDGRLDAVQTARLLDAVGRDPSLGATWERYHLIGAAIRGEAVDPRQRVIAERVRQTLAPEPTVLAPPRTPARSRQRLRRFAALALAASLASVVFINAPTLFRGTSPTSADPARPPQLAERAHAPGERWHLDRPDLANKLDLFLVTHQATVPATGAKGMLPYATLVGYQQSR
jgi:sigma-E factor negative regulatory protein RseA